MFHEAVHAYLTAKFCDDAEGFQKDYSDLFDMYQSTKNIEGSQHEYIAQEFINPIASALQQFGWNSGVNLNYEYYQDLAWGGLAGTEVFKSLESEKKNRINNRLSIELTHRNMDGEYTTPKDDPAGC